MDIAGRARYHLNRACERANDIGARRPSLLEWQRRRFFANARRFAPTLGVEDHRGNRYFIRSDDPHIGGSLFLKGAFDLDKLDSALRILGENGCSVGQVLDIGANIGTTTIELLSRLPDATAVAFEPEPVNFGLLRQNVVANDLDDRVALHQAALSDRDGEVSFELAANNRGDHRVRFDNDTPGPFGEGERRVQRVLARRLDDLVDRGEVVLAEGAVAFIDVQGHEGHALAGATTMIDRRVPLVLEFWPYGLGRVNGLEMLVNQLATYDRFVAIADGSAREIAHRDLAALASELGADPEATVELVAI